MKKFILLLGTLLLTTGLANAYSMPRWGVTAIDVYLPESGFATPVRQAFEEWSKVAGNKVRFRYYSTRFASNNAPIKVTFSDEPAKYNLAVAKRMETTGYFMNMDDGFINRASLTVYSKDKNGNDADYRDLYGSILSEIGYILGLEKVYGKCDKGDEKTIMCQENIGKDSVITPLDRRLINEKYDRSSEDIKIQKSKKSESKK